jgi:hypothetical protein
VNAIDSIAIVNDNLTDNYKHITEGEARMIDKSNMMKMIAVVMLGCVCVQHAVMAQQTPAGVVHDDTLGVGFAKVGAVAKVDSSTYRVTLPGSDNTTAQPPVAQLTATDRLFVDLPGSYGGRLYFDDPAASRMIQNRMVVDTVQTGEQVFKREYWVVYAGMGMWEGVINCYTQEAGRYYVVSLVQEVPAGKPGEGADDKPLTSEELKAKVLTGLRDTTNVAVAEFTTMLHSVQINK